MKLNQNNQNSHIKSGVVFSVLFILFGAVLNYLTASSGAVYFEKNISLYVLPIVLWTLLYAPMVYFVIKLDYQLSTFGLNTYRINKKIIWGAVLFITIVLIVLFYNKQISLATFGEGYARTGEEIFFRGFLYALLLEVFKDKKKPYIWAIILSSLAFALVHTQTFLHHGTTMFDVFTIALMLSMIRYYSNTIVFGIIFHCTVNNGILTAIIGVLIYLLIALNDDKNKSEKCKEVIQRRINT